MHVLVTCKYIKDRIKTTEKMWRHHFPHYKSTGLSVAMETTVLIPSAPHPMMLHIKFDQDWPTGFRDIQV